MTPPLRIDENELGDIVDSEDSIIIEGEMLSESEARYIIAAVNACHRAGLTVEEMEASQVPTLPASPPE